MSKNVITRISGLKIGYGDRILYEDVCFDICQGDCIMLCGANGSGKTTLLKCLASENGNMIMIPTRIPKVMGFTLKEFIRISCHKYSDSGGRLCKEHEKLIQTSIDRLGLHDLSDRDISTLSDGEFQKACIASALARKAAIILMDEPTAFLDAENRIMVMRTIRSLCDTTGTAVIFSTHDLSEGLHVAGKVIALGHDGIFRCSTSDMKETTGTIFKTKI